MKKGKVIDSKWYTPGVGNNLAPPYTVILGVVLVHYPEDGYVKAYLGIAFGHDQEQDETDIAEWGAQLEPHVARAHFPSNDIPYKGEEEHA